MVEGGPCAACGATFTRASSWSGSGENKYCHLRGCIREGIEAGDIVQRAKKQKVSTGAEARIFDADEMRLLKAEYVASTRLFAAGALDGDVAASNEVPDEERVLMLLVYGKIKRNSNDKKGCWGHFWIEAEELQEQGFSEEQLQELRDEYRNEEDRLWGVGV